MPRAAYVYHEGYDLQFGDHVFPSMKYKLIRQRMIAEGLASEDDFHRPEEASDDDLELVHTPDWVRKLNTGTLTYAEILKLEIPYSQHIVRAFRLAVGGTILASRLAMQHRIGFNIGGGFHHAFPSYGEGFCALHDVAVAIRRLQHDRLIEKAMVIDVDVHHGNGTASIFANDSSVFTLSIHQYKNYPDVKPPSNLDIHLNDGTENREYLLRLEDACRTSLSGFRPDLICYLAGADPYERDQLGGLNLTIEGLRERDALVFEIAAKSSIPVSVTLAGGYAISVDETVSIHFNTARAAEEALGYCQALS